MAKHASLTAVSRVLPGTDLPGAELTNERLSELMEEVRRTRRDRGLGEIEISDPEFPERRLGILSRRVLDSDLTCRDMAVEAAKRVVERTDIDRSRIRAVLVTTVTSDRVVPCIAASVQHALGLGTDLMALDLTLGCNGFVAALDIARRMMPTFPDGSCVLLVATETMTRVMDAGDRNTCPIFGDAASAVLLESSAEPLIVPGEVHTQGAKADLIQIASQGDDPVFRFVASDGDLGIAEDHASRQRVIMEGRRVFADMVRDIPGRITSYLDRAGIDRDEIDTYVFHQANRRMIEAVATNKDTPIPDEKLAFNIERLGNTTSASIPILLADAIESGALSPDGRVLLVGFGTGYSLGLSAVRLAQPILA